MDKQSILEALRNVIDPDLKQDIVSLGMVGDIELRSNNSVEITLYLTTPACPLKEVLASDCEKAIKQVFPKVKEVKVAFKVKPWQSSKPSLPSIRYWIGVASGKGGVGKSTLAVNIAATLQCLGAKVGILDADIYGPSVPILMGLQNERPSVVQHQGRDYMEPVERYGIYVMSIGFLASEEKAIAWRGPMASNALRQLLTDTWWPELDYLIIDLPPGTGDIPITVAQLFPLTGVVIITTPQRVAVADAVKAIAMFSQPPLQVPILGIVENMAYFIPPDMPEKKYYLFGKDGGRSLAQRYNIPFLGAIPLIETIAENSDLGVPIALEADNPVAEAYRSIGKQIVQWCAKLVHQKAMA